jgi:hypothetical protein
MDSKGTIALRADTGGIHVHHCIGITAVGTPDVENVAVHQILIFVALPVRRPFSDIRLRE